MDKIYVRQILWLLLSVTILTYLSTSWITYEQFRIDYLIEFFTIITLMLCFILLGYNYFHLYKASPFSIKNLKKRLIEDVMDKVDAFNIHFENVSREITSNEIKYNSKSYKNKLSGFEEDIELTIRAYCRIKVKELLNSFIIGLVVTIIIFSLLFILDYNVQYLLFGKVQSGFEKVSIPDGNFISWLFEGIYFTVITLTTLGYGYIHPSTEFFSRFLVICEAISTLYLFTYFFSISFGLTQMYLTITPKRLLKLIDTKLSAITL